jgi:O-antigen ligase
MSSSASSPTPLLTSFRAENSVPGQAAATGAGFENLLVLLGCLLPIAVCVYSMNAEPLISVGDVEFTQPDVVFIVVALVVFTRAIFKGFHSLQRSFFLPLFFFLLSAAVSSIVASDKLRAAAGIVQILEFGLLAWCFSLITSPKLSLRIVHSILGLFIFETIVAAFQFAAGASLPTGTFGGHQQFAFYTSFSAAMAFALFVNEKRKHVRSAYLVVLLVLLFGSLIGQERASWLSFLVAGFVVALYAGKRRKQLLITFAATVLAAVILVASIPQLRDITISRLAETENDSEQSNSLLSRLAVWGVAYNLFVEHPILGVGPKNFTSLVPHYLSVEDMMGSDTLDTHNVWIGTLAEQGVIGFITYLILCIAIIRLATRVLRTGPPSLVRALCLSFLAYHVFWFTMSQHYFSKGSGHIHFMIIGLMLGLSRGTDSLKPSALRSETN